MWPSRPLRLSFLAARYKREGFFRVSLDFFAHGIRENGRANFFGRSEGAEKKFPSCSPFANSFSRIAKNNAIAVSESFYHSSSDIKIHDITDVCNANVSRVQSWRDEGQGRTFPCQNKSENANFMPLSLSYPAEQLSQLL